MLNAQYMGMQGLPVKMPQGFLGVLCQQIGLGLEARAVDRITQEGVADGGKMHPDLVGAAGLEPAFDEARDRLVRRSPGSAPEPPSG